MEQTTNNNIPPIQEPEEKKNVVDADFNPLDNPVNDKPYTRPQVSANPSDLNTPIGEPRFNPPPINNKPKADDTKAKREPKEPFNQDMKNLSKKDTEKAASFAAELVMSGYEGLHTMANKGLVISEKKILKLQADGEINLNAMIDYDYGKKIRAGDFIKDYNTQASTAFVVSDEFKEKVMPLLIEILSERGVGVTKEQALLFIVAQDIASKGFLFVQMKSQMNFMMEQMMKSTTAQYAPVSPQPQAQPVTPPYNEPKPQPVTTPYSETVTAAPEPQTVATTNTVSSDPTPIKPTAIVMPSSLSQKVKKGGRPRKNEQ